MAGARTRFAVKIDQRPKAARLAADDRDHQWQTQLASADKRGRRPAYPDPDRQQVLKGPRKDALAGQRRAEFAGPLYIRLFADLQQQFKLFGIERIVFREIK